MKIIGNGMIAQSFKDYDFGPVCIFASGVSDSTESDTSKYLKEYELVKRMLNESESNLFVYFSTLSVLKCDYTEYVKHKLFIEFYIKSVTNNFLILRLPNIVGKTKSENQLLPFLYNSLLKKEKIQVKKDTIRDLIDVEDLPKIVEFCIDKNINGIINTSLENKIKVIDIIDYLIKINDIKDSNVELIDGHQNIEYVNDIKNYYEDLSMKNVNLTPNKIIEKYYGR